MNSFKITMSNNELTLQVPQTVMRQATGRPPEGDNTQHVQLEIYHCQHLLFQNKFNSPYDALMLVQLL